MLDDLIKRMLSGPRIPPRKTIITHPRWRVKVPEEVANVIYSGDPVDAEIG